MNNDYELRDSDREEIARLIAEGNEGGILSDDSGRHINWGLHVEIWDDKD